MSIVINGQVVDRRTADGVVGLRVEGWSANRLTVGPLATAETQRDGAFQLTVEEPVRQRVISGGTDELFFRVFREDRLLASTEAGPRWPQDGEFVRIEIDAEPEAVAVAVVTGRLRRADGSDVEGAQIQLVERIASGEVLLASAATSSDGVCRFEVSMRRRERERKGAVLRAIAPGGVVRAESDPFALRSGETMVDLVLGGKRDGDLTEFDRDRNAVALFGGDRPLATLPDVELDRIARDAGIKPALLERLRKAARVAEDTGIPVRALYALDVAGIALDVGLLSRLELNQINEAFQTAARRGAVKASAEDAAAADNRIRQLRASTAPLAEVARITGIKVDDALVAVLGKHGIRTLEDLRRAGAVADGDGIPRPADNEGVRQLEALSLLALLPADLETHGLLLRAGYATHDAIAATPRDVFVRSLKALVDETAALAIHTAAVVQLRALTNTATLVRVDASAGRAQHSQALQMAIPTRCACEDCRSASSPMAYLADLIDYASRHITVQGNPIGRTGLEDRFLQPFSGLPMTCEALDARVRQPRIAIEVLRRVLPVAWARWTPEAILQEAYFLLLGELGTSFEQLRDIRTRREAEQIEYLRRIGLHVERGQSPAPVIDMLFREPGVPGANAVTEEFLEDVFGLRDTRRDPLSAQPGAALLQSRLRSLREDVWVEEDWPAQVPADARPLIDPDMITPEDLVDATLTLPAERPRPATRPVHLWEDRWDEIAGWTAQIDTVTQTLGFGVETLEAFITDRVWSAANNRWVTLSIGLGITTQDFESHAARQAAGEDISPELQALRMDGDAFAYLAAAWERLRRARPVTLITSEWGELRAILIQRLKAGRFAAWRAEERAMGLTLSPRYFRSRSATSPAEFESQSRNWRSSTAARQRWEDTLRARGEQEAASVEGMRNAVDRVERTLLAYLRDALITNVALPPGTVRAEWLTQRYLLDFATAACHVTTRIAQAIETLQGLLAGARHGLLEDPTIALDAPDFDAEWQWLGSYASWNAALQVFIHPEIALRPTLRRDKSEAFETLLETLRASGSVTPDVVQASARVYTSYFNDVCSLKPVSVYESTGWEVQRLASATTAPCVIIARAGSGKLYFSGFERRPAWYLLSVPPHTFWAEIKVPAGSEITGLVPFQSTPGDMRLALYARTGGDGAQSTAFASYDGSSWTNATASEVPDVLTSVQYPANAVIPPSGELRAAGIGGWRLEAGDRFIPLAVEGFGGRQRWALLAFAATRDPDGSRRVGVLRGREGGLELTAFNTIDGGWSLPAAGPILLWSGGLQYLLVVRPDGPLTQLGLVGTEWPASGRPVVRWATADGFVYDAGNASSWRVNAQAIQTAANLEGDLSSDLIALEYEQTQDRFGVTATSTRVTVLRMDGAQLRLVARPLLDHPFTNYPNACKSPTQVRATRVVPVGSGALDRLLFLGVDYRVSIFREGVCTGTGHSAIFAWEAQWNVQTSRFQTTAAVVGTGQYTPALPLAGTDEFLPLLLPDGSSAVLLMPVARDPLVMLKRNASGALAEVWRTTAGVIDAKVAGGDPWPIKAGDRFSVAGAQLLVVREDGSELATLDVTVAGVLEVRWMARSRVRLPGLALEPEWFLRRGASYAAIDIDDDGAVEFVTIGPDGTASILRTVIALGLTGDPLRNVGPYGVSVRDIVDRRSRDWLPDRAVRIRDAYDRNGTSPSLLRYLDEAFHFIPTEFGMRLRESGYYTASLDWLRSVYDYSQPAGARKISHKLVLDEHVGEPEESALSRYAGWLLDPLNPHMIAELRPNSFTRHAQLAVVRSLLDFADAEFSRATSESVPRARELYLEALELLRSPEIRQDGANCESLIRELEIEVGEGEYKSVWGELVFAMSAMTDRDALSGVVQQLKRTLATDEPLRDRLAIAQRIVAEGREMRAEDQTLDDLVTREDDTRRGLRLALMADAANEHLAAKLARIDTDDVPGIQRLRNPRWEYVPAPRLLFCVPPNPTVTAAVRHAELNLQKIRTCRNIAGVEMHLEPYALAGVASVGLQGGIGGADRLPAFRNPTLQPSPYRYRILIERANQLVDLARQIEASMLQSLQSLSVAQYEELRGRQDLALARAGVRIKDLQLVEASDGVTAARLQSERAQFTAGHYGRLLNQGLSLLEGAGLAAQAVATGLQFAGIYSLDTLFEWAGAAAPAFAQLAELANTGASYERRAEEWRFQRQLGQQDVRIAGQQIRLAQDRVRIAAQERALTLQQVDHAETMLEFIQTKRFGTAALYEWMSGVLEQVYRFFLQQATAIAQLAEAQLAFERQQIPPTVIRADYWEPPGRTAVSVRTSGAPSEAPDTHGLTGSARLLRDLYELDQHAFRTNQRKLQLTETLSLAQIDPFAFQQFRTTGVLPFATPMSLFDRRFPGHYLRLIRSVRTSVIALAPPSYGIRATLATTGTSRTVIGGDRFQVVSVQRGPESVALSAPMNATGLFELDVQPEMLAPFEGIGVDTSWEFQLPKASNPFDFSTIADVLVTIEYTALDSASYRDEVIAQMDRRVSADRGFSIRHQFADAWYDLHNPDQVAPARRMIASFQTTRSDFPVNIENLAISHVALYCVSSGSAPAAPLEVLNLRFQQTPFGQALSNDQGIISTRRGNGANWVGLIGRSPVGAWEIALPDTQAMRRRFTEREIDELLLTVTYSGRAPAYPR